MSAPSAAVRAKAATLTVATLTRQIAFVNGGTETYMVVFEPLGCSCAAGYFGILCSHVVVAQAEREGKALSEVGGVPETPCQSCPDGRKGARS